MSKLTSVYNVSVCMATYNGGVFLRKQIESILPELGENDELIIVDDCSTDETFAILKSFKDQRIKLILNKNNEGVNAAFCKALGVAINRFVLLSDQDDYWRKGRVQQMIDAIRSNHAMLVTSNCIYVDAHENPISMPIRQKKESESNHYFINTLRIFFGSGNYPGCAMAMDANLLKFVLPFPSYIESHDLWIAKCANLLRANYHLEDATLFRRVHGENVSLKRRPLAIKLKSRIIFIISIFHLAYRIWFRRIWNGI